MIAALVLFVVSLTLSSFFSGCETGFYRAPRLRLVIDSVSGDRIARGLLWGLNHPEAVVATLLVGNNVVNYLASSAIVAMSEVLAPSLGVAGNLAMTVLFTPVVFLFGELLPKRAFLRAPYLLLRRCSIGLLIAGVLLALPSVLLWVVSRLLSAATGSKIQPLRMAVRRRELADAFDEGQAVGLLSTAQRDLAMATFSLGGTPLRDYMVPVARQPRLAARANREDALRLARRYQYDAWPLEPASDARGATQEYVRASRLLTSEAVAPALPLERLTVFAEATPFLHALTELESSGQPLAAVVGPTGRVTGYVRIDRLQDALWQVP